MDGHRSVNTTMNEWMEWWTNNDEWMNEWWTNNDEWMNVVLYDLMFDLYEDEWILKYLPHQLLH